MEMARTTRNRAPRNSFGSRVAIPGNNSLDTDGNKAVGQLLVAIGGFVWGVFIACAILRCMGAL